MASDERKLLLRAQRLAKAALRSRKCADVERFAKRAGGVVGSAIGSGYLEQPFTKIEGETVNLVEKALDAATYCRKKRKRKDR